MRCMSWLTATSLAMMTAGCGSLASGPTTYGYGIKPPSPSSGVRSGGDPGLPALSRPAPVEYSPPAPPSQLPASQSSSRPLLRQDELQRRPVQYGRDRDWNGDGIPDRYQYKQPEPPRNLLQSNGPDPRLSILGPPPVQPPPERSLGSPVGPLR
jgi:hypothetical protein